MKNKPSIIIVDKEKDLSSNAKLMEIKKTYGIKKCGFVGTLDPFATGLLIICCNNYTKLVDYFHSFSKTYVAQIKFGATTPTLDNTSEINYTDDYKLQETDLIQVLNTLSSYEQTPPMFSAKKVNGKRAYQLARENKQVTLKPKLVHINQAKLISIDETKNEAVCEFSVSSGTYIRTLCDDIAQKMNTRAYLINLRRTSVGPISVNDTSVDLTKVFNIDQVEINNDFELKLVKNGQIPNNIDTTKIKGNLINVIYKKQKIALFTLERKLILFYD